MRRVSSYVAVLGILCLVLFLWWARSTPAATPYFTIDIPANWQIRELPVEEKDPTEREFEVLSPDAKQVFVVVAATDEPRFVSCFCAPWDEYKKYEKNGIEYADLTIEVLNVRTLKAVGRRYGTDVHLRYGDFDKAMLDETIESIRPW